MVNGTLLGHLELGHKLFSSFVVRQKEKTFLLTLHIDAVSPFLERENCEYFARFWRSFFALTAGALRDFPIPE
jgi:hypothetical protein